MSDQPSLRDRLEKLGDKLRTEYVEERRVMSFAEYLDLVAAEPKTQLRSAPQWIRDCFRHYGSEEIKFPWGRVRRFKLFDCPWADGRDRLIGQEEVQNQIYRALENFVQEGVANKLILLHGPNGSAKSTIVRCIGRAMQHYSSLADGAVYRFNWIFPSQKISKSGIGFSGTQGDGHARGDTYAYLPEDLIDAKLSDELRDHPLFLLPKPERRQLIETVLDVDDDDFVVSDYLNYGRLSHKNKTIYEALLSSYRGDFLKVMRHVQVERFYVEHRYREGFVTVEPQLSVDATERQITADRSVSALPAALQSSSLYEYGGELTCANRGLIEYSDLLKRPMEAFKYLITTVESAAVSLHNATLYLDLAFIGTTNEIHLAAFKEIPEFQSFKGRVELVRVPYLLDFQQEKLIYDAKLREAAATRHLAPHCAYVAALWAVLTRMRKPMADKYPKDVSDLIARLTPLEKADLYADGKPPDSLTSAQSKELISHLQELWTESDTYPNYEGRSGASPRELQVALFNAASSSVYSYVSPLAILDEIETLTKQTSVYEFLKQEALPGGFHDHRKFIGMVRERLIDVIDDEVRWSMGLVEEAEYQRLFERYITHVMHWTKNEKVRNPTTGRMEEPDESMMRDVEKTLDIGSRADEYRQDLIAKIGAWSLDHPKTKPNYSDIFADHFKKLKEAYFEKRKKTVKAGVEELLKFMTGNEKAIGTDGAERAKTTLNNLLEKYDYNENSARDAVMLLVRNRYAE